MDTQIPLKQSRRRRIRNYVLSSILLLLIPLRDAGVNNPDEEYSRAFQLFLHGKLETCQKESERNYQIFRKSQPEWAEKFQLLEAEAMSRRGLYEDALRILTGRQAPISNVDGRIHELTLTAMALTRLSKYSEANYQLVSADKLCATGNYSACGDVLQAHGVFAIENEQPRSAKKFLLQGLELERLHGDHLAEAASLLNLGVAALHEEHYDEALDWSRAAYRAATDLGAEDHAQMALGNQGWAYFRLGDSDRALRLFVEAGERARKIGDNGAQLNWLTTSGDVYAGKGELASAETFYHRALVLGRQLRSKEDIVDAAMDLAEVYVEAGRLNDAETYIKESLAVAEESGNRLNILYCRLIQGQIALLRKEWIQGLDLLHQVEMAPESEISMKWASERAMARLYEAQGKNDEALREYQTALATFEAARAELKNADSQLPFVANATRIYDDYIHFLVQQGKVEEALQAADQSRARTLSQGLGVAANQHGEASPVSPTAVARKANATLLFYWLGEKQSYLWVVTPQKTVLSPLPAKAEIEQRIEHYRSALMGPEDPIAAGNPDGRALYAALVTPAAELIDTKIPVMILADGALCQLNFATLIAPPSEKVREAHYWIEDATVISAPSLAMLAAGQSAKTVNAKSGRGNLLLMGDAISPDANYPQLAYAATEMQEIEKHFGTAQRAVYARERAVPAAYLKSDPRQYAYIHFVSHGVASQTDPLDSAIILSKEGLSRERLSHGGEDSFKLYAREIMQHPIDARLVTISACYGNGTRVYVGEGLVGLSWAFLHAGAHNAIGALWAADDRSTAQLMDTMYAGLSQGEAPWTALREAQLELLHSKTNFRKPFYWAPFQVYTRM